jgi:tetratricopeptide (TPR) repeat protein
MSTEATVTIRGKAPGEADFFYTLERVMGGLLAALKAGRIDEAVDVYTRCREDIGYQIISRSQGDPELFRQVANLFFRARDFSRAAYCCEHLEEPIKAAALYERCDDWPQAAMMYAQAGDRTKAAEMFEKAGNLGEAAKLFKDLGEHLRAAQCFERGHKWFDASQSYQAAGQVEKAIQVLNAIDDDSPDRKVANKVIKELMAQAQTAGQLQRSNTGQLALSDVTQAVKTAPAPISITPEPILVGGGQIDESGKNIVTVMEGFEVLRELPLFAELSLSELKQLYTLCVIQNVDAGAVLIQSGQPAPALFLVMRGELEVKTPAGEHVTALGLGQHAGEMSLVDESPATVDVVASAPSRIIRLDKPGFKKALAANDGLALRVMRVFVRTLIERLRDTTARIGR